MTTTFSPLPTDLASAHAMILAQREMLEQKQSELTLARSDAKVRAREIERLKLLLAKARRERFGQSSERGKLIVEQVELAIEDLEETQGEEEAKAEIAAPAATELLQYSLDPGIAGGDFLLVDVVKRHRLLQDEQGARQWPVRAFAITSALEWRRLSRIVASTTWSRSPAIIAQMMRMPVAPMASETT